jgi:hypothetical protein
MTGFTAKVHLSSVQESGTGDARSAALRFAPDYRDGRNADWAHATPGLALEMTVRGDVIDRLGLRAGQDFTLTFGRDGDEQGVVSDSDEDESDEDENVEVHDLANGGTKFVTRSEARRLGYDVSGGAAQGVGAGPTGTQPITTVAVDQRRDSEDAVAERDGTHAPTPVAEGAMYDENDDRDPFVDEHHDTQGFTAPADEHRNAE